MTLDELERRTKGVRQDTWKSIFEYSDGNLYWKIKPTKSRVEIGQVAGKLKPDSGYRKVGFQLKTYLVHRVIWEWHYGPIPENLVIDHINGDSLDNRIENLRLVTMSENAKNRVAHRSGKILGICQPHKNKWRVTINFGTFYSREEAERKVLEIKSKLKELL